MDSITQRLANLGRASEGGRRQVGTRKEGGKVWLARLREITRVS